MTWLNLVAVPWLAKLCLVCMFPPSALDKVMHWDEAMEQASSGPMPFPGLMLALGIAVEAITPVLIVIGVWDRAAAFVLMGFCAVTAVLFHRWWEYPDFWSKNGPGRSHFWDFFKNLGLVGGLLLVVVGGAYVPASAVVAHPLSSGPRAADPSAAPTPPPRPLKDSSAMADPQPPSTPPTMPYWHVYTDPDGVSRQARFVLSNFEFKGVDPEVAPQWNDRMDPSKAGVTFTVLPVGWVGDWHENPKPQWIAVLTGRWFVETMDGVRVEMGPGELMFGEDQGTKPRDGRKGHLSGTVGDVPCTMIVTGLDVEPTVNQPGRFR